MRNPYYRSVLTPVSISFSPPLMGGAGEGDLSPLVEDGTVISLPQERQRYALALVNFSSFSKSSLFPMAIRVSPDSILASDGGVKII